MAIKHGSKVDKSFSASSMTDLMFLLLLFLLIATTLINPNALKLMLPKSSNQLKDKAMTTVSIKDEGQGTTATSSSGRRSARSTAWSRPCARVSTDSRSRPSRCTPRSRSSGTRWSR